MTKTNNTADPARTYAALRDETAALLKLDPDNSGLVENLQIDLVALLRLEVDGLSGAALAGEQVDLQRLAVAHGMLQKLLPAQALVAPAHSGPDVNDAVLKVEAMINGLIAAQEARRHQHEADLMLREEMAAIAAAALDSSKPTGGDARDGDVARPSQPAAPASGRLLPAPQPTPKHLLKTDEANSQPIPAHYLRDGQQREPWYGNG